MEVPGQQLPLLFERNKEYLRLLSVFHYIAAGIIGLFACLPLIHVAMGVIMFISPEHFENQNPDMDELEGQMVSIMGLLFAGVGLILVLAGWTMAVCTFLSGRYLAKCRRRIFSVVVAAILCAFFPVGTILGAFTIAILFRESVEAMYNKKQDII